MDDNQIKKQMYVLLGAASIFILLLSIFYFCHITSYPISGPRGLQNFAVFFGGVAAPIMTLIAVIPLVMTLLHQQRQFQIQQQNFQDEQKNQRFLTYISKFEQKISMYEELAGKPVGLRNEPNPVILKGIEYVEPGSEQAQKSGEFIDEIPTLMSAFSAGPDGIPEDKIRDAIFLFELANHAGSACRTLSYSFKFATKDDYQLLYDSTKTAGDIVSELMAWKILDLKAGDALFQIIKIPDHLKPKK